MIENDVLESVKRLSKDLRMASVTLSLGEVRYIVDAYYTMQDYRTAANKQKSDLAKRSEPHELLAWVGEQNELIEKQIHKAMDVWTDGQVMGRWLKSLYGIGPVIAAGLLAHIDITKAPTAGHIWRFAGLDPTSKWLPKTKRPWNAKLKTLAWKIGESFVKVSNNEKDVYGHIYAERKNLEWDHNFNGELTDQCSSKLENYNIGKDTDAYVWYSGQLDPYIARKYRDMAVSYSEGVTRAIPTVAEIKSGKMNKACERNLNAALTKTELKDHMPNLKGQPMLPPAHIQSRSKRYAVKLFLSHFQYAAFLLHYGKEAPKPFVITHMHHVHEIKPTNLHIITEHLAKIKKSEGTKTPE